ncbi:uncharacterized protein RHOBADRAFT_45018 [Rhodotorula graminis WP1]|uniref:Centromere protein X n=1 Tax=Rhodotorula graminis (strain WP1) TaxID=578459 RepID=A0A194S1Y7_RHOGW|nr:uncharacterized protein RHOBADRAFT_45018 [Rhodotorula graminis WP1]KPV74529.1 hypothetical protein RHOBADRAFT_45018 [Rhodotorula graminis WP1]
MDGDHQDSDHPQFKQARHRQGVSTAAVQLSAEYLRLFATEAIHRAAEVAERERINNGPVDRLAPPGLLETKHLEKVLAGLLLDFS